MSNRERTIVRRIPRRREENEPRLYWAYGSNLNMSHMRRRCPDARPWKPLTLDDGQLIFRGVADAISAPGKKVTGALWKVTPRCLASLDRYEGCNPDNPESKSGLYRRKFIRLRTRDGEEHKVLYYQMNRDGIAPPGEFYLDTIMRGYQDFGLDMALLDEAVRASYDEKNWTDHLRERHEARGQKLARKDAVSDLLSEKVFEEV